MHGIELQEINSSRLRFVIHSGKSCADTGALNREIKEKGSGKECCIETKQTASHDSRISNS